MGSVHLCHYLQQDTDQKRAQYSIFCRRKTGKKVLDVVCSVILLGHLQLRHKHCQSASKFHGYLRDKNHAFMCSKHLCHHLQPDSNRATPKSTSNEQLSMDLMSRAVSSSATTYSQTQRMKLIWVRQLTVHILLSNGHSTLCQHAQL